LWRTINTPFFSLTMDIRDPTRTGFIRQQDEGAIVEECSIRRQHHASLPLEQIRLNQQLGENLDKNFGGPALPRHPQNSTPHTDRTSIARTIQFKGNSPDEKSRP
jgi:hypothetical protein